MATETANPEAIEEATPVVAVELSAEEQEQADASKANAMLCGDQKPTLPLKRGESWIEIATILQPRYLQPRAKETDSATVLEYRHDMTASPLTMPALTVYRYGDGTLNLASGWQRIAACRAVGHKWTRCMVVDGDEQAASIASLVGNTHHGLKLEPNEAKAAAVRMYRYDCVRYHRTFLMHTFKVAYQTITNLIEADDARIKLLAAGLTQVDFDLLSKRASTAMTACGRATNVTGAEARAIFDRGVALHANSKGFTDAFAAADKLAPDVRAKIMHGGWNEVGFFTDPPTTPLPTTGSGEELGEATDGNPTPTTSQQSPAQLTRTASQLLAQAPDAPRGDAENHARLPVDSFCMVVAAFLRDEPLPEPMEAAAMGILPTTLDALAKAILNTANALRRKA